MWVCSLFLWFRSAVNRLLTPFLCAPADYAAKQAVDTAQQLREAASAPAYPQFARSSGANGSPLDSTAFSPAAASTESSFCQDDQRDPSIAAGKRAAPSSSLVTSSQWDQCPVASSPYASTANGAGHGSAPEEENQDSAFNGLGGGSTRANFPDYESVTQQIYDYHQQPGM